MAVFADDAAVLVEDYCVAGDVYCPAEADVSTRTAEGAFAGIYLDGGWGVGDCHLCSSMLIIDVQTWYSFSSDLINFLHPRLHNTMEHLPMLSAFHVLLPASCLEAHHGASTAESALHV